MIDMLVPGRCASKSQAGRSRNDAWYSTVISSPGGPWSPVMRLAGHNTQVTFAPKTTQSARGFNPAIGAKLPPGLKTYALPPPLIYEMPKLKRYTYLKFKVQVLIVNPMDSKIVDMFPQT
jgi:hypothetical protein